MPEDSSFSVQRDDAVCFSAGITGVAFGAGVIHAYFASDRKPPHIIAGISLGAVTAAAMERSYYFFAHEKSRQEAARWKWFRRYLAFLVDRPYDVMWDGIPNTSDCLADLPPVSDPGIPINPKTEKSYRVGENFDTETRRRLHILSRLGRWLARLPVNISAIAWLVVRYVRFKEGYPPPWPLQVMNFAALLANLFWVEWKLIFHIIGCPQFFPEWQFKMKDESTEQTRGPENKRLAYGRFPYRPLLGWTLWLVLTVFATLTAGLAIYGIYRSLSGHSDLWIALALPVLLLLPVLLTSMQLLLSGGDKRGDRQSVPMARGVLEALGIQKSLFHNFRLRWKLFRVFGDTGGMPFLRDCVGRPRRGPKDPGACKLILVSAPLQILKPVRGGKTVAGEDPTPVQLWPEFDVRLSEALRAALALPGVFEPLRVEGHDRRRWLIPDAVSGDLPHIDLVDGSSVRQNPLPALFSFIDKDSAVARRLSQPAGRIYLVSDVPILKGVEAVDLPPVSPDKPVHEPELPGIIDTGFSGQRLARRRDSRLEELRTNHISQIERSLRKATGRDKVSSVLTATVEPIAPADDLRLNNELAPTETEILTHVAAGCRQTLGVLYRAELREKMNVNLEPVSCRQFLEELAHKRHWSEASSGVAGASEVCRHCTRKLIPAEKPPEKLLPDSFYAASDEKKVARFPTLARGEPNIVFLASGGVFRGSFHVGMLGALLAANIKPDMIVGASVGTLMGAALGAMFSAKDYTVAQKKLARLGGLFVDVDKKIALTKGFKAAMKDLGVRGRGRSLQVSPNDLRKLVREGSRSDPGAAATGAPPALVDAISDLFLIPYNETRSIAAEFIAGHVPDALQLFWKQIEKETIQRLGIREAVLGASLLERELEQIVAGLDLSSNQPFRQIAFFATTVDLTTKWVRILGAEMDLNSYDLVEALLSSCAFPAAFAPRRESAMYPGCGRRNVFFGDGGMFDNLPILPAIEIIGGVQHARSKLEKTRLEKSSPGRGRDLWRDDLLRRQMYPDLFLVGALEARQEPDPGKDYDTRADIAARAGSLAANEKIYGFQRSARKIDGQLERFRKAIRRGCAAGQIEEEDESYLNRIVNAAILPVYPSDETFLNGTFHFCQSLGMKQPRIRKSIANGCFRTLESIALAQAGAGSIDPLVKRSVDRLTAIERLPQIRRNLRREEDGMCPFFTTTATPERGLGEPPADAEPKRFRCPFHGVSEIHETCKATHTIT